ncbi:hypothetical protein ACFL1V_03175 [Pseudomonadota bacterium]
MNSTNSDVTAVAPKLLIRALIVPAIPEVIGFPNGRSRTFLRHLVAAMPGPAVTGLSD